MDHTIDVNRWITAAEEVVSLVDSDLCIMGACQVAEDIGVYDLANLDTPGVAAHLKRLAERLQTVATNLIHLADNADLSGLVEGLKSPRPAPIGVSNIQHLARESSNVSAPSTPNTSIGSTGVAGTGVPAYLGTRDAGCDTHVSEASPGSTSESYKSESDVEFDRLLAELEEPISPSTPEMEIRPQSDHTD